MDTKRQEKISRLIQRSLGQIFQQETRHMFGTAMITVTHVRVTGDLSIARVYLSLFATDDKKALFRQIEGKKAEIRGLLGKKVGKQIRKVPDIQFFLDEALDEIQRIDDLLGQ